MPGEQIDIIFDPQPKDIDDMIFGSAEEICSER